MAAAEWWCWPLPAWFVLLNVVVGAIFALSSRAQPQSPSPRRGGSRITRRTSSVLLQRLRSFSSPSSGFQTEGAPDSPGSFRGTDYAGTRGARSPSAPRAVPPHEAPEPTTSAAMKHEDYEEEDVNSMSMDDVYALVLAGRHQPPPTEEEAARSEVDAKAEEFIRGFKEDLRQQRLNSIFNYTQMLKRRAAGRGTPVAAPDANH